ncbi:MAG: pyruvate kinase [Deltaproteobacteria bacterium]|nr:pyruvate kinase [Deltaproteobacteria bacterium]
MILKRKAKIICTIGPSSSSPSCIAKLIQAGMDIARLNFSHGDYPEYKKIIRNIRSQSKKIGKFVAIMQDLQGPKIRVGDLKNKGVRLKSGQTLYITTRKVIGDQSEISIPYHALPHLLKRGNSILLDDGLIELEVLSTSSTRLKCCVKVGGFLKEHKGVNLPYIKSRTVALTGKDKKDLKFALKEGVDMIALSFVRSAHDILVLKNLIPHNKNMCVVAKIEKPEAFDDLDNIIKVSDAVMVARGDLAVESSTEAVPRLQKQIIMRCNRALKPVITATQMLESMIEQARPTRAEASDVANAIFDGSDCLMLSGETAVGKYPVRAVATMHKIICEAEKAQDIQDPQEAIRSKIDRLILGQSERIRATEKAACEIAHEVGARLICCLTEKGTSAKLIARGRPLQPIIAFTHQEKTIRLLSLVWGVRAYLYTDLLKSKKLFKSIRDKLLNMRLVKKNDRIVITTGLFIGSGDTDRIVKLHKI